MFILVFYRYESYSRPSSFTDYRIKSIRVLTEVRVVQLRYGTRELNFHPNYYVWTFYVTPIIYSFTTLYGSHLGSDNSFKLKSSTMKTYKITIYKIHLSLDLEVSTKDTKS